MRKDGKEKYLIEFLYTDNDQLYQTYSMLTKDEVDRLNELMNRMARADLIKETGEGNAWILPFGNPKPMSGLRAVVGEFKEAFPDATLECPLCQGLKEHCRRCHGQGEVPLIEAPRKKAHATAEVSS